MDSKCHLFFDTISNRLRLDILSRLREKPFTVNELSSSLGQERSKVSHALKALLECRFVNARKKGRMRIYSLNRETMLPLLRLAERHVEKYCRICGKK